MIFEWFFWLFSEWLLNDFSWVTVLVSHLGSEFWIIFYEWLFVSHFMQAFFWPFYEWFWMIFLEWICFVSDFWTIFSNLLHFLMIFRGFWGAKPPREKNLSYSIFSRFLNDFLDCFLEIFWVIFLGGQGVQTNVCFWSEWVTFEWLLSEGGVKKSKKKWVTSFIYRP